MGADWSIREHRGRAGLVELEADWRRIYRNMPQRGAFHLYDAHLAYVDHLMGAPDRLRCIVLVRRSQPRAICLLESAIDRSLGIPLRVWATPRPSHMPIGDVVCAEDEARRELIPLLLEHLRHAPGNHALLRLGPLPDHSILWEGLRSLPAGSYAIEPSWSAHVIDCSRPLKELMAELPRKLRQNLRRQRRKLDALPEVRFVTATQKDDLEAELNTFLDLEAAGWKGAAGTRTAIRFRPGQSAFFRSLRSSADEDDGLEINSLYVGGRCIASWLCMRTGAEYTGLKTCYDENYSQVGPGLLSMESILDRLCGDPRISRFNLVSDATWLTPWRPDTVPLQSAYVAVGGRPMTALPALLRFRFGPARSLVRPLRGFAERLGVQVQTKPESRVQARAKSNRGPKPPR